MLKKYFNTFTIGIALLVLYMAQYLIPSLQWKWLYELQHDQDYRRWSGLIVTLLIVFQWLLTLIRVVKKWKKHSVTFTSMHKWVGAFSPLIFYAHCMEFGFAYLLVLSIIFMTNMLLGTINLDVIKSQKEWIFQTWMIVHVSLSIIITFVMFFHIGVVFYYK